MKYNRYYQLLYVKQHSEDTAIRLTFMKMENVKHTTWKTGIEKTVPRYITWCFRAASWEFSVANNLRQTVDM